MNTSDLQRRDDRVQDDIGVHALAVHFVAEVAAAEPDGALMVVAGAQRFAARLAYGCLVEPVPGDRVACWRSAWPAQGERVYVLAVLERRDADAVQCLRLAPRAELRGGEFAVHAEGVELRATRASFVYRTLHSVGELCKATIGQLQLAGAALSTVFDRQTHHAQQHQRSVQGIDRVQAQVIEHQADEVMHLRSPTVLAEGERLVKVRGAQIHFG